MKSFLISLLLLLLLLCGIAGNAIYINHVANDMSRMTEALPDIGEEGCVEAAASLRDYWERNVPYVGLSVGYPVTDRVSEQAAVLSACAACGDLFGYRSALALLQDAIGDVRRLEKLSIENLL